MHMYIEMCSYLHMLENIRVYIYIEFLINIALNINFM